VPVTIAAAAAAAAADVHRRWSSRNFATILLLPRARFLPLHVAMDHHRQFVL